MPSVTDLQPGDHLYLRDRPWAVAKRHDIETTVILEVNALDGETPQSLTVSLPPDTGVPLPTAALAFQPDLIENFHPWALRHRAMALAAFDPSPSAARWGRVSLEAYQLAPLAKLLAKPRPSLLIADDVGLGKTIEAGLAYLELQARGRAGRTLFVVPPGLIPQWQEELRERFGLSVAVIESAAGFSREQTQLPAGVSPWDVLPRILTSMDFLKKTAIHQRALKKPWDLVIVDEAHALAESGTPQNPYRTQRTRLGLALREAGRGLILLTATPHNGYPHSFRSLLQLVDPSLSFLGDPEAVRRRISNARIRRMKSQITRRGPDGKPVPVFPKRTVQGIAVTPSPKEQELLNKVSSYCSKTARAAQGSEEADLVAFAMQIIKKRALSSRVALQKTIENRLQAIDQEPELAPTPAELQELQADLPLDEASAERVAARIVRAGLPREERRRKSELSALKSLRRLAKATDGQDSKASALAAHIKATLAQDPQSKTIVFTEYRDTLASLHAAFTKDFPSLRLVTLTGGMSARQRTKVQEEFESPGACVLLATDAASEGLNLQKACHRLVHFELPWNPNRLEQRNGRVDRYGQKHPAEIHYLFYPDSPEDDVLNRLVHKIETMHLDQISTPDILGILQGMPEITEGLVGLDSSDPGAKEKSQSLVRTFEERTAYLTNGMRPFLFSDTPAGVTEDATLSAAPLMMDDESLEPLFSGLLGPDNLRSLGDGLFHIRVPLPFQGPGVLPAYPKAAFQRSVALHYSANEVDYISALHPLARAMATHARRRFLQVWDEGSPARRLAVRLVPGSEPPSAVFSFWFSVHSPSGVLAEGPLHIRLSLQGNPLGDPDQAAQWTLPSSSPGNVDRGILARLFSTSFQTLAQTAAQLAHTRAIQISQDLHAKREIQAKTLSEELKADVADRLQEIEQEERAAKGLVEGDQLLLAMEGKKTNVFEHRRAELRTYTAKREQEIADFARVDTPHTPQPMSCLFLVPEGQK